MLDIDRDRQRISLGLKQTQEDPWQRVVDTYNVGDELEGKVTKVVAFGAFVEILEGVEGLVHISELAQQHVENPREIVQPGDDVKVKILEIDSERRRLSLSIKRVEGQVLPRRDTMAPAETPDGGAGDLDNVPELGLSEDVFASAPEAEGRRGAEAAAEAEAPRRGRGRAGRARREARRPAAADPSDEPGEEQPEPAVRRPDRRDRGRQVGGARALARLGAATLSTDAVVHELYADPRCARRSSRWGRAPPAARRPRGRRAFARPRTASGSRSCCGRGSARACGSGAQEERRASRRRARSWSRRRCCSRRMDGAFDATLAVVADEAVRRERAGARGHAALDERTSRQLTQEEKAARATSRSQRPGRSRPRAGADRGYLRS